MATPHDRTLALDGIRGIAAFGVLLFHVGLRLHAGWLAGHGSLAVDVFFCMSGFVVERAYGARLRAGWSATSFARARFERLYPLYAAGLALGAVLDDAVHAWQGRALWLDVLGVQLAFGAVLVPLVSGGRNQVFPLNGPSWSLFVEACLNLAFVAVPKRYGTPLIAAVVALAGAVLVGAALARLALTFGGRADVLWLDLARGGFGFGLGILLCRLDRRSALGAVPRLPTPLVFAALAALLLVPRTSFDVWFDPLAVLFVCPGLVALAVRSRPSARVGLWSARAGALSYPLYMVHEPILAAAVGLRPGGPEASAGRAMALAVAAAAALGLAAAIAGWSAARSLPASDVRRSRATAVRLEV